MLLPPTFIMLGHVVFTHRWYHNTHFSLQLYTTCRKWTTIHFFFYIHFLNFSVYLILILLCLFIFVNISDMYDVRRSSILYPNDVSHSSLDPLTKLPMVIWKYVLPEDQFEILVKGCVTKIS